MLFAAEVRVRARAQEALLAARGAAVSAAAALLGPEPVAEHQLRQLEPQHQLRQRGRPQLWPRAAGQQKVKFLNPANFGAFKQTLFISNGDTCLLRTSLIGGFENKCLNLQITFIDS